MEPTKQQTVAFFAHVKAQKANKVRASLISGTQSADLMSCTDVFRLFRQEPDLGIGTVRYLHLP